MKILRKKLVDMYVAGEIAAYEERKVYTEVENSITEQEKQLLNILGDITQLEYIDINSKFITIGLKSLKATLYTNIIRKEFDVNVSISKLYELENIKELSKYISTLDKIKYDEIYRIED